MVESSLRRFAIAMDAADRRDEALLADFWYPDARAGAFGVRWVENCVRSADNGACWVDFRPNSPAQGVRPEPLRLFFCPRQLGFIRLMGAVRQPLERSGAIVLRGNRQCLHIVPWIDLQFAEVA